MKSEQENRPFVELLLEKAQSLLEKAEQASPDSQDQTYTARTFHQLTEELLQRTRPENIQDYDIGAVAQTAEEHFKKRLPFFEQSPLVYLMANLLGVCLHQALEEEGRKLVFPILDYGVIPEPAEDEMESYSSGYDPLALHKFTQRIITKCVLRVRGDDYEIFNAIRELNEAHFVETTTREEFIKSLADLPDETREHQVASFDNALSAQPEHTPEIVAALLRKERERMIQDYTSATFQMFRWYGDHAIRCGISAALFLAAQYSNAIHADRSGMPKKVFEESLPGLTDLKKAVAEYFADWLTQPLVTRPRPGKKPKADLDQLSAHYDAIINDWRDAYHLCRSKLGLRSAELRKTWRNDVRTQFQTFPEDLIERLQPMAEWPEDTATICSVQGGEDNAEDIALEHAARMCSADRYAFKLSSLREIYRKQRRAQNLKI
jgi:hypothetical protein